MSKKILILLLCGFISINVTAQININSDSIFNNSGITTDAMKFENSIIDSTLNAGGISRDSLVYDTLKHQCRNNRYYARSKAVKVRGTISNGYEYGVSPYVFNNGATGFFKSEGNIGLDVFSMPINVRYYYSTLNVIGLNNSFSASFDVNRYKDNVREKMSNYEEQYTSQMDSLLLCRQKLIQKKAFLEREIENKSKNIDYSKYTSMNPYSKKILSDSLSANILNSNIDEYSKFDSDSLMKRVNLSQSLDSIKISSSILPVLSPRIKQVNIDSLEKIVGEYQQRADQMKIQVEELDNSIKKTQNKIQSLKDFNSNNNKSLEDQPVLSKYKRLLFDIKKFDVGLCYPSYSNFLIKGAAIKGVNVEFENKDFFVAFSHGTSVNTFVNPLNAVESNLNKFKQMFDFLDFSNQDESRRLTSMMFGYGKKQGNHLHAGFLYGTGNAYTNYSSPLVSTNDKNYVIELDGRAIFGKVSYLDFSYGKSSVQGQNEVLESNERGFSGIFSPKRTNAALVSLHTQIPKINTKVQLSVRWLDPYFKSFGIGFLKSDNLRYEIKADQRLSKRVNVSCLLRKTEDNLLNLFDYKNKLNTFGIGASVKWSKRLTTKVNYNMILQSMNISSGNSINSKSYISTYILNYQIPRVKTLITGIYNDYNITDATTTNKFQNILLSGTTDIGKNFKNNFTVNIIKSNMKDSLKENNAMISNDIIFIQKRFSIAINGKYAFLKGRDNQFGYGVKATVAICKSISLEGSFERIVYGSYYNYITVDQIDKFPYYCTIKLNYTWK